MKILHTSDWHLGKSLYDFSLLEDQAYFIEQLLAYLGNNQVDAVVIAGDIYDRPIPPAGAIQLYDHFLSKTVNQLGIPVLAIAGNHDSASRLEFGSSLYQKSGYYVVGSVQNPVTTVTLAHKQGDVCFTLLPYLHPADVRALWQEDVKTFDQAYRLLLSHHLPTLDPSVGQVAVAHGFFARLGRPDCLLTSDSEVSVGGLDIADSCCFAPMDYVALGHLHSPQQVGDNLRYSGSPLKYSLSEEDRRKSFLMVTLEQKGQAVTQEVFLPPLRDLRTVTGTLEQLLEPSYHHIARFDDYVFAQIQGPECLYPMQKLRTLFPRLLGLRFGQRGEGATSMSTMEGRAVERMSVVELFGGFYRQTTGNSLSDKHLELLAEVLEMEEEVVV